MIPPSDTAPTPDERDLEFLLRLSDRLTRRVPVNERVGWYGALERTRDRVEAKIRTLVSRLDAEAP